MEQIRAHFDSFGVKEWERLEASPAARVSFEVHRRFLRRFVKAGDRVLEIGAGPGRFTLELAAIGARVAVTDYSPVQLALNEEYVARFGGEDAVEQRLVLDVRDAAATFPAGSFDVVVAYGGPLSYVFEDAPRALAGLFAVARDGAPVVASVMSLLGTWRAFLPAVLQEADKHGDAVMNRVLDNGDLRPTQPTGHVAQMYTATQVRALVEEAGARMQAMSASNWASLGDKAAVERIAADVQRWTTFIEQEARTCAEAGALDGGTHLLFAASR